jgi:hypothetical protein
MAISNGHLLPQQLPWIGSSLFRVISYFNPVNPSQLFAEFDALAKPISGNALVSNHHRITVKDNNEDGGSSCCFGGGGGCSGLCSCLDFDQTSSAKEVSIGVSRTLTIELAGGGTGESGRIVCILDCYGEKPDDLESSANRSAEVNEDAHHMIRLLTEEE